MFSPIVSPDFTWAAARKRGTSHHADGTPCQDALTLRAGRLGAMPFVAAAVADGAGSALFAEQAARTATRLFTRFVTEELPDWGLDGLDDLVLDAASGVHSELRRMASKDDVRPDQYATTLLGAVVTPEAYALIQIGDGGIVTGPPWSLVFPPQHGEYANETFFITDDQAMDRIAVRLVHERAPTLVLFTDGLEDLLVAPRTLAVHPPLFDRVASSLAGHAGGGLHTSLSVELNDLMGSGSVRSRTDDDTTLLAIHLEGDR